MATTTNKPSGKLIREWEDNIQVGIWDNCRTSIRLYCDRAIYRAPYVRWQNNTGSLDFQSRRIVGADLAALLKIATHEDEDDADYTEEAFELLAYPMC